MQAARGGGDSAAAAAVVVVEVPVKLGGKAGRCVAALTLSLAPRFRAVLCGAAEPVKADQHPSAVDAEHESAAAVVSQPELLLPPDAVHGEGADAAETRSFLVPVRGSEAKGGFSGQPMLVRSLLRLCQVCRVLLIAALCHAIEHQSVHLEVVFY